MRWGARNADQQRQWRLREQQRRQLRQQNRRSTGNCRGTGSSNGGNSNGSSGSTGGSNSGSTGNRVRSGNGGSTDGHENNSADEHDTSLEGDGVDATLEQLMELQVHGTPTPVHIVGIGDELDRPTLELLANANGGQCVLRGWDGTIKKTD